jgi:translation initiation factor IF-3
LISEEGDQLGITPIEEAQRIALEKDLDLVEVAPQAKPPVCKVMDYGKYMYELEQKQKAARKKQNIIVVKEMKMRPKIDVHDYETKKRHVVRFLEQGNKVKVTIMFRGREMTHTELGLKLLNRMAKDVEDLAEAEAKPKLDGRNMTMVLAPRITDGKKE